MLLSDNILVFLPNNSNAQHIPARDALAETGARKGPLGGVTGGRLAAKDRPIMIHHVSFN